MRVLLRLRCEECQEEFDAFDDPKSLEGSCPECGSEDLTRLQTPPNHQFKGSGFYSTDKRDENDSR